jgi:hypothetical protein
MNLVLEWRCQSHQIRVILLPGPPIDIVLAPGFLQAMENSPERSSTYLHARSEHTGAETKVVPP